MIHTAEGFHGYADYAKLSGVSPRNIRDRIRARSITYAKVDGFYFVNAIVSPPKRRMYGKKSAGALKISAPHFSFDGLREVGRFARGKHYSEGIFYEAILTGRLDGYVIGNKVFLKPDEAEHFYRNR